MSQPTIALGSLLTAAALMLATPAAYAGENASYSMTKGGDPFITILDTQSVGTATIFGPKCSYATPGGGLAGRFIINNRDPGWSIAFNDPTYGDGYIFVYVLDTKALTWSLWMESTSAGLTFQEAGVGPMFKTKKSC